MTVIFAFLAMVGVLTIADSTQTEAMTAPDACYDVYESEITWYYRDMAGCPKDLDVSSTIAGVEITGISAYAFNNAGLTRVSIPNTITFIGEQAFLANNIHTLILPDSLATITHGAFRSNQIEEVVIPNTVTSIGESAFEDNRLKSVTIPSEVSQIGPSAFANNYLETVIIEGNPVLQPKNLSSYDLFEGNGSELRSYEAEYIDQANIVRIYTESAVFQATYPNKVYTAIQSGDTGGAFITNPAQVEVSYVNEDGVEIAPRYSSVGLDSMMQQVPDYALLRLQHDLVNQTADFSPYYVRGSSFTAPTPTISGYVAPAAQAVTLQAGLNELTVVYASATESASGSVDGDSTSTLPGTPDTGIQLLAYNILPLVAGGVTLVALLSRKSVQNAFSRLRK